jgi:hypothetical protein
MSTSRIAAALGVVTLSVVAIGLAAVPSSAFGGSEHRNITHAGFMAVPGWEFLHGPVLDDIENEHAWSDSGFPSYREADDFRHFDDCDFDGATGYIREQYANVRVDLFKANLWDATDHFGRALHPAQDLYSHSNWVELGFPRTPDNPATAVVDVSQSDLMDISGNQRDIGTPWSVPSTGESVRGDVLLANDDLAIARDWRIIKNGAGAFQSSLVRPNGTTAGRLLETGKGTGDNGCVVFRDAFGTVAYSGFSHGELNKDDGGAGAKYEKFKKARALAVLQTGYEWCRLVSEAGKGDRDGMLLAMWVKPRSDPHPPNTPCASGRLGVGFHPITVSVESVLILDDGEPLFERYGEIQLAAALYDNPQSFRRSDHRQSRSGEMSLEAGDFVPQNRLPEPMTICVRGNSEVNFALYGWDNDDGDVRYTDEDELLVGGTAKFSSEESRVLTVNGDHLQVRFRVTPSNDRCR